MENDLLKELKDIKYSVRSLCYIVIALFFLDYFLRR